MKRSHVIWLQMFLTFSMLVEADALRLNEIFFKSLLPERPIMVELQNTGPEALNLTGVTLADSADNRFSIPEGSTIAAGGFAVVIFGGPDRIPDPPTGDATWIFCGNADLNRRMLQEKTAESCTLYPTPECAPETQLDDVTWGHMLFSQERLVQTTGLAPGEPGIPMDGSIARPPSRPKGFEGDYSRSWLPEAPGDVSLGRPNPWPTPQAEVHDFGRKIEVENPDRPQIPYMFQWRGSYSDQAVFRVQAAKDPRFRKMLIDTTTPERHMLATIPVLSFFWRVRWEEGDSHGAWSPVYAIRNTAVRSRSGPPGGAR